MSGKKILAIVCGLVSATLASQVMACMSAPDGWYLEANGGSSNLSGRTDSGDANRSGLGGNVNLGYKFLPYLGAELGYSRYANNTIETADNTNAATIKNYSYDIAVRGILPFGASGFEAIAKLGAERMNAHLSINDQAAADSLGLGRTQESQTGVYVGIGAQYYFMPEFAAVVQWQRATGNSSTGTEDLFSAGLSFIFD